MRHHASVTSLSWIPTEAVTGLNKAIFGSGFTRYDPPPPDHIEDLDALRDADRFRFANQLAAWIEVDDGVIVDAGYEGGLVMGSTTVSIGRRRATFAAVAFPDLRAPVAVEPDRATFVQTVGGHTGLPAPRHVNHAPFVQLVAPTVWTTLALTIRTDGHAEFELTGASPFPRHWVYDATGRLAAKAGLADFREWWRHAFGRHTPWGDEDSPALVTTVETALEREVAGRIMQGGATPQLRTLPRGSRLTEQGTPGTEVFLLLDGVVAVDVDGEHLAEVGPGAILGERAVLEGGLRTSTLRAVTNIKVAVVRAGDVDRDALARISEGHRREEETAENGSAS